MKISYNWLKEYINVNLPAEELSDLLTNCGLEVEGVEQFQSVQGGLEGVVIGEVLSCEKHPDADRLTLTKVDVGAEKPLDIVCGAPNVAVGQKVPVALVGTTLYTPKGEFVIKKAKIRGHESEGMICAEDELGLGDSHDGIMVLDPSTPAGMPAAKYFNIENDTVFEIGLTPNRGDATSHIGVARDVMAVLNCRKLQQEENEFLELKKPSVGDFKVDNRNLPIPVEIIDKDACPRYTGLTITGIDVKESPEWLKNRLKAVGLRPINNVVDITNYVLMETGQPLHAFDADKIKGGKVIVKKLPKGTKFTTLDEFERELTGDDLMICDAEKGMCIGGVFGGLSSGVIESTKSVFFESAYFDPVHIRKTSKHHGLKTDASFRFERGADPEIAIYALKRAALLIKEIAGGKISSDVVDEYPKPTERKSIQLHLENLFSLSGMEIPVPLIKNILASLEIDIQEEKGSTMVLSVPAFKSDVEREADIVEEILRIYGYSHIPLPESFHSSLSYTPRPDRDKLRNIVSNLLTSQGFHEIMCNSLIRSTYAEKLPGFDPVKDVFILNPISLDLNVMRQSLLFGGLETIAFNQNRKSPDLKIYEFGTIYSLNEKSAKGLGKYKEDEALAIFMTGAKSPESWYNDDAPVDLYLLKAHVMNIFRRIGLDTSYFTVKNADSEYLHAGLTIRYNDEVIAEIGSLSQKVLKYFDIKLPVYFADINWVKCIDLSAENNVIYKEISHFPEVRRDLALLLDKNVPFVEVELIAKQVGGKLLKKIALFDVFEGEKIGKGKKSYAVSFTLQDEEKTLTDKDIDKVMGKLMAAYKEKLGAEIR